MKHVQKKRRNYLALLLSVVLLVNCSVSWINMVKAQSIGKFDYRIFPMVVPTK